MGKKFKSAKDCYSTGWDFEAHLLLRFFCIIVGGVILAACMMGWENLKEDVLPSHGSQRAVNILTIWLICTLTPISIVVLLFGRRIICCHYEKKWDEHHEDRIKNKEILLGEDYPGQYRNPNDNPYIKAMKKKG